MNQLDKDTYESIYKTLIDSNIVAIKWYKWNPRIKPKFFVDAIFEDYFIGKTVDSTDLKYTQLKLSPILGVKIWHESKIDLS